MKDYQLHPPKHLKAFTDDDLMPFGKHKGERLEEIDAGYFLWLWDQGCDHPQLRGYIIRSFDALVQERPDKIVTPPTSKERELYK